MKRKICGGGGVCEKICEGVSEKKNMWGVGEKKKNVGGGVREK